MSERGKKNSKFHPTHPCTKCTLCGKSQAHYSHFQQWSEEEQSFLVCHLGWTPPPDSCICCAHHTEANRHSSEGNYIPKRRKDSVVLNCETLTCAYPGCNATLAETKIIKACSEMTQEIVVTSEGPSLLCQTHYQHLYRLAHAPALCADCGAKPKYGTTFSRHSPNATLIEVSLCELDTSRTALRKCVCNMLAAIYHKF